MGRWPPHDPEALGEASPATSSFGAIAGITALQSGIKTQGAVIGELD